MKKIIPIAFTLITFLLLNSCKDSKEAEAKKYLQDKGLSIISFSKYDGQEPMAGYYKLFFNATLKNGTSKFITAWQQGPNGPDQGGQVASFDEGKTYQIKAYINLQKMESGWNAGDHALTLLSINEVIQ